MSTEANKTTQDLIDKYCSRTPEYRPCQPYCDEVWEKIARVSPIAMSEFSGACNERCKSWQTFVKWHDMH